MKYLNWKEEKITDTTPEFISKMYDSGFLFTRIEKGIMHQTRSVRVDLDKFELSSENRRIIKKGDDISFEICEIPYQKYDWKIGKIAKDFYDKKAPGDFSVNKIKEIITTNHNFNTLINFSNKGYVICYINNNMIHYSYPFYDLENSSKDMGMIMMTKMISEMKTRGLKYFYLGSLQRSTDVYKLQFSNMEWFDGTKWSEDLEEVKKILLPTHE
jgi:arginyl-tRNA--protein-N-Asp/Glu arginylyltransferase